MMRKTLIALPVFLAFSLSQIYANTISGQDCQGQDLICDTSGIPSCGGVVCYGGSPGNTFLTGIFTNVGLFQVSGGNWIYTVSNQPFAVFAATVNIIGTIDASGAGAPGGAGGSGSPTGGGVTGSGPSPGTSGPYSSSGGSVNAGGGGGYGGAGGNGSLHPGSPDSPGQGGISTGTIDLDSIPMSTSSVSMGSGGGGGTGQQLVVSTEPPHDGGVGGYGGGSIYIEADSITVSGTILVNGSAGSDGINSATITWSNSSGAGGGGGGSGGGILLRGLNVLDLETGIGSPPGLHADGGAGGGADGYSAYGGGGGGGGRVKLFYGDSLTNNISISTAVGPAGTISFGDSNSTTGVSGSSGTIFLGVVASSPTNLSVTSVGNNAISFQFNATPSFGSASSNSDSYHEYNFVSTMTAPMTASSNFIGPISTVPVSGTYSHTESSLTPNTLYQRFVTAYSDYGDSLPSNVVSTWTWADVPLPPTITGSTDTVVADWTSANPSGTTYYAEISTMSSMVPIYLSSSTQYNQADFNSSLPANTTYYIQVQAINGSNIATAFTSTIAWPTFADVPFNLNPSAVFESSITLSWSANDSIGTTYLAEISEDGFLTISSSPETASSNFTFKPLRHNTTYYFRVGAINYAGSTSAFSSIISTITLPGVPLPAASTFTNVTADGLTVNWGLDNPNGTNFYVEIATDPTLSSTGSFATPAVSTQTTNNNFSFPISSSLGGGALSFNTTYYAHVQTQGYGGDLSAFTAIAATATLANIPGSPVFSQVYFTSFTFSWSSGGDPPQTSYTAEISSNGFVSSISFSTTDLSATFAGLTPDVAYDAQVEAVNYNGLNSNFSTVESTTTLSETPTISGFSNVRAQALSVNWQSAGNGSGADYEIDLSTNSNFSTLFSSAQTLALSWNFSNLLVNDTFYAQVRALPSGAFSPPVSTVTLTVAPSVPLASNAGLSSFTWRWSGLGNPPGTSYFCEISTNSFQTLVQSSQTYNLQAVFVGLSTNTVYQAQVGAVNFGGMLGPFSSPLVSTSTLAAVPANIQPPFSGLGSNQMTYTWENGTNPGGTSYVPEISTAPDFSVFTASDTTLALSDNFRGLLPNTTYYGRVQALNYENIPSVFSSTQSDVTFALAPSSASPVFSAISSAALSVNWTGGGNPAGTEYEAQILIGGSPIASSDTFNFSAPFASLLPDTTYQFQAAALNYAQISSFSAVVFETSTLAALPQAAIPPEDVVSSVAITAQWNSGGNPSGALYAADVSTSAGLSPVLATQETNSQLSAVFNGLAPDTTYYFQVRAINNNGIASSNAPLGSAVGYAAAPSVLASTSTGLVSVSTFSFTNLVSTGPGGIGFYRLAFNTDSVYSFTDSEPIWTGLSSTQTDASCNGSWSLWLKSYNALGLGDAAAGFGPFIISSNTPSSPGQPVSNTGKYASTSLGWNWSPAQECGSSSGISYLVSVGTSTNSFNVVSSSNVGQAQNFVVPNSLVVSGQSYYAVVESSDSVGKLGSFSMMSGSVTDDQTSPLAGIPQAPSYNYVSTVTFTWTAATDSISGISGYVFELGTSQGGSDVFNQNVGDVLSYAYTFASDGVYYARVSAVTGAGLAGNFSASSPPVSVWVTSQSKPISAPYNWPNPFNPNKAPTNVGFYVASPATVTLKIFTLEGNLVYRVSAPVSSPGNAIWPWSGRNGAGRMIEPGGYIAVIEKDYAKSKEVQRFKIAVIY